MNSQLTLDLGKVPSELRVILELLKKNNLDYVKENKQVLFSGINWELFIEQAKHHRIYPVLYSKLKEMSEDVIPSYVIKQLSIEYKRNTFKMLQLSAEMEQVSRIFTEDNIRLLFLKGPVIAHDIYGEISLRTSSDLDFIIPIKMLERAEKILVNLGYEKDEYIKTMLNDWTWRHHHVTYIHPQKRLKLEMHWRLNPGPGAEPSFEEMWQRRNKSKLTNYPVFLLGKEDLFLFLVSHGARHGWSRLRWLLDIHQLIEQEIDWGMTNRLLKKYQFHNVGAQALVLTKQLLQSEITDAMKPVILNKRSKELAQEAIFYLERMVNLHTEPVPDDVSQYHSRHLFSLMSIRQRVLFVLSCLHPYPEDADIVKLPKQLHFLYFPLRPFIWAWKWTRKHALP